MISLDVSSIICDGIRNTEINKLQLAPHKNEICGLQIRMNNLFLVDDVNGLKHLLAHVSNRDER